MVDIEDLFALALESIQDDCLSSQCHNGNAPNVPADGLGSAVTNVEASWRKARARLSNALEIKMTNGVSEAIANGLSHMQICKRAGVTADSFRAALRRRREVGRDPKVVSVHHHNTDQVAAQLVFTRASVNDLEQMELLATIMRQMLERLHKAEQQWSRASQAKLGPDTSTNISMTNQT